MSDKNLKNITAAEFLSMSATEKAASFKAGRRLTAEDRKRVSTLSWQYLRNLTEAALNAEHLRLVTEDRAEYESVFGHERFTEWHREFRQTRHLLDSPLHDLGELRVSHETWTGTEGKRERKRARDRERRAEKSALLAALRPWDGKVST